MVRFDRNKANYCRSNPILYPLLKEHAKKMRECPTGAESVLWTHLQQNKMGKPFRRQYIIGDNIVDFACLPAKLVVEVDGAYHDDVRQKNHDLLRTHEIERQGFHVVRFTNDDIFTRLDYVLETIKTIIQ